MNAASVTGGVDPADSVHDEVVDALDEEGIGISDRAPREISSEDVEDADYVVTMGCSVDQFRPEGWSSERRKWDLEADETREQRDEIASRVADLFDEIEARRAA